MILCKKFSRGATAGAFPEIDMPERRHLAGCLVPTDCVFVTENELLFQRRGRRFKRKQLCYLNVVVTASNDGSKRFQDRQLKALGNTLGIQRSLDTYFYVFAPMFT